MIVAGDIGGTRSRLVLADASGRPKARATLESRSFDTFDALLGSFLEGAGARRGAVRAAVLGVAGPVVKGRCTATNLPFVLDERRLERTFGIARCALLNDMIAVSLGATAVPPRRVHPLRLGRPARKGANLAIVAAGTGLGEAALVWDGERHVPLATEGAHVDFAPRTELEWRLAQFAREGSPSTHVSFETVAAASSLGLLYRFLVEAEGARETKARRALVAASADPSRTVSELALRAEGTAAGRAVSLWASIYGAEAKNLALKALATGGVYVCGGAAERLAPLLDAPFLDAFLGPGRMRDLLERVPVARVSGDDVGLLGSLNHAISLASHA